MDKRKILIILIIFIIAIILFLFLALSNIGTQNNNIANNNYLENNNNNIINNNTNNNYIGNNQIINNSSEGNIIEGNVSNEIQQPDEPILSVKDYFDVNINSVYFSIMDLADNFFNTVKESLNGNNASTEELYYILGKDYVNKNDITKENLPNIFSKYINYQFKVEKIIEKIEENNICVFIVYGSINEIDTYTMAIITDENSLNYCIYPNEYLIENDINNLENLTIEPNIYNSFKYRDVNPELLAQYHLADYIYYAKNNPEKLYNKLDSEYSAKRFGSLEKFKKYIQDNAAVINSINLASYKVTRDGNTVQYNCIDNYGNHYSFKETSSMQYTAMLDNYTIMSKEDIEYYNNLDKFEKGKYNLIKFINMVNTKDYKAIYDVLDPTFRTNNFKDESELENFIRNNMYSVNNIELDDLDTNTYEYYIFECTIINKQDESQKKKMTVILNQSEGTDFTMSFSFVQE